jgi:ubiquinone/menaquinone biosynthesis C-methylase UbiE
VSAPANFNRLAHAYRWMEYLSFGTCLMYVRQWRIPEMQHRRRALVYGDGDGRFLARLVRQAPGLQVTAVDASARMLQVAARRLPPAASVQLVQADALGFQPSREQLSFEPGGYDLIVSHFFLDCFSEDEVGCLVERVNAAAAESAVWVISDFAVPQGAIAGVLGRWIIRGLYQVFGLLTGLETRRLPDHGPILRQSGWHLEDCRQRLCGLLVSERWQRNERFPSNRSAGWALPIA